MQSAPPDTAALDHPGVRFVLYLGTALVTGGIGASIADAADRWDHDVRSAVFITLFFTTPPLLILAFVPVRPAVVALFAAIVVGCQVVMWLTIMTGDGWTSVVALWAWWVVGVPVAVAITGAAIVGHHHPQVNDR